MALSCWLSSSIPATKGSAIPPWPIRTPYLTIFIMLTGCSTGAIDMTALNYQSIDPPSPRVLRFPIDRAYWWLDEQERLWIAIERRASSLLGDTFRLTIRFSFVLEKLPAGKARNYRIRRNEVRGVARFGPAENRYTSNSGILAVYREREDRLRVSFRMEVNRYVSELLTGWSEPSRYLVLGRFDAVRDDRNGRAIVEDTEDLGFERDSPRQRDPTTSPAESETKQQGGADLPPERGSARHFARRQGG